MDFHSKGGSNRSRYKNAKVDALAEEAKATFDDAQRKKLYSEATKIILGEAPVLHLFYPSLLTASNNRVENYANLLGWNFKYRAVGDVWMAK